MNSPTLLSALLLFAGPWLAPAHAADGRTNRTKFSMTRISSRNCLVQMALTQKQVAPEGSKMSGFVRNSLARGGAGEPDRPEKTPRRFLRGRAVRCIVEGRYSLDSFPPERALARFSGSGHGIRTLIPLTNERNMTTGRLPETDRGFSLDFAGLAAHHSPPGAAPAGAAKTQVMTYQDYNQELINEMLQGSLVLAEDWHQLPEEVRNQVLAARDEDTALGLLAEHKLLTPYQADRIKAGTTYGLVLGNYRVLERIGAGGMGVVFRGEHALLRRTVAIKVLPLSRDQDVRLLLRFQAEMRMVATLQHPNIVAATDAGSITNLEPNLPVLHYLVMEYVPGRDLEHLIEAEGALEPSKACEYIHQIAGALSEAYTHNLVHRDIKPSNILVTDKGVAKLLDFGLAQNFQNRAHRARQPAGNRGLHGAGASTGRAQRRHSGRYLRLGRHAVLVPDGQDAVRGARLGRGAVEPPADRTAAVAARKTSGDFVGSGCGGVPDDGAESRRSISNAASRHAGPGAAHSRRARQPARSGAKHQLCRIGLGAVRSRRIRFGRAARAYRRRRSGDFEFVPGRHSGRKDAM